MISKPTKYLVIILTSFLFLWGCEEFFRRKIGGFAGSYPFVEYWDLKASEEEVISAIEELGKIDPNFHVEFISKRDTGYIWSSHEMIEYSIKLRTDSLIPLPEKNYNNYNYDYWRHVNLYYPDTQETVYTWTRPSSDTTLTTFAFVSLGKTRNISERKLINRDFWYLENKKQIKKI